MLLNQLLNGLMVAHALHNDHPVFSFGVFPPFVKNRIEEKIFIVNIYYETFFFFFIQQKKPGDRAMLKIFVQGMKKGGP